MRTDGWTHTQMTELIVAFRNIANAPKIEAHEEGRHAARPDRVLVQACSLFFRLSPLTAQFHSPANRDLYSAFGKSLFTYKRLLKTYGTRKTRSSVERTIVSKYRCLTTEYSEIVHNHNNNNNNSTLQLQHFNFSTSTKYTYTVCKCNVMSRHHITFAYYNSLLYRVQPDDGHHEGPKRVAVARLTSLAIKVQYSCVYDCFHINFPH
jgi:hypothetical protein